jgi:DNA-binding response OmpR family regulator
MHCDSSRPFHFALHGKRILVVEDEVLVALMIENGLVHAGAEVIGPAYSVDEALTLIEHVALDGGLNAAVLDMNLQGEAVSPVADRLAALGVPFIFATGYEKDCYRGCHAAAPILTKPFGPRSLVAIVKSMAAEK